MEAGMAWTYWEFGAYFGGGEVPVATGTRHRRSTPYQAYRTRDAYVTVGANNEKLWTAFCTEVLERPGLIEDARFKTRVVRLKNIDALQDEIEKVFATQPTEHWVKKLDTAGVPGGPVFNYVQAFENEHSRARNMVAEIDHPKIGRMKILGNPVKASAELARSRTPAPWLGQHSAEVMRSLGYSDKDIDALQDEIEKVFATQPTGHWVKKLDAAGVPGGPVFNYVQAFDNEHSRARNMVAEIDHPKIGRMKILGNPVKASAELARSRTPAPWLGQHSAEVLKGLGYGDSEIASLFADGVTYDRYRQTSDLVIR